MPLRTFLATLAAVWLLTAQVANATEPTPLGVVELFTSQGCSSCPPADAYLIELARRDDVIALGFHVDYWDMLGWKDTMGSPENSRRQYAYRSRFGANSVYTPQAVINGRVHVVGSRREVVDKTLREHAESGLAPNVPVSISKSGGTITVTAGPGLRQEARLLVVYFDRETPVKIERGENRGRTISYANAVTGWQTAGMWYGESVSFQLPASEVKTMGKGGCAVLLQAYSENGIPGPILGAAVWHVPLGS